MPASQPTADQRLTAFKQFMGLFCRAYRRDNQLGVDASVAMTFEADGLPVLILVQPNEPTNPAIGDTWFNHVELYRCTSNVPVTPLHNTWKVLTASTDLWQQRIRKLNPPGQPTALNPLQSSGFPVVTGCQMVERLYLYADAVEDMEAVPKRMLDSVAATIAQLQNQISQIVTGSIDLTFNSPVTFNFYPTDPKHGVNKEYVDGALDQLDQVLSDLQQQVTDMGDAAAYVQSIQSTLQDIQSLLVGISGISDFARLSGAHFGGRVYVPIDPDGQYDDNEVVPYAEVKRSLQTSRTLVGGIDVLT